MLSYLLDRALHRLQTLFLSTANEGEKCRWGTKRVARRLDVIAERINELYLFGPRFTVADAYLFAVSTLGANSFARRADGTREIRLFRARRRTRDRALRDWSKRICPRRVRQQLDTTSF